MEAANGEHTYTLGMNHLGDLTREEINRMLNGFIGKANRTAGGTYLPPSNVGALPTTVDWRRQGYVTKIKDQKDCGSGWAFSATGSLEGQHYKKTGILGSLSAQNLVDCSRPNGNRGCGGGRMDYAFTYIASNNGIDIEAAYPYTARNGTCHFQRYYVGADDVGYTDIPRFSEINLKSAVATVGPVSVAIDASRSSFHFYKSGLYNDPQCSTTRLDHGVLAVGYGTIAAGDYWLVKNSWGLTWGMKGYIMMSRNKNNQCGIATMASYPRVEWRQIFQNNLNYINKHNMEAANGEHTYTLGMNHLGDLTREEINRMLNGFIGKANRTAGGTYLPPSNVGALPTTVDWRRQGYVTKIKDQKDCGSGWAFSATGSLEGQHYKKTGILGSLSAQNLVDCSRPNGNRGCGGGRMDYAFTYIASNNGIDIEAAYPYTARNGTCHFQRYYVGADDVGYTDIPRFSEINLKSAVATVGPVSVAIDASRSSFHFYKSGLYNDPQCSTTRLDHGVLAVGYGTIAAGDYWLVKNSWGLTWGMKGYIMMSRNKNNQCGIATMASYPRVEW